MRFRLRELMVLVAVGPPLLAGVVWFLGRPIIRCRYTNQMSARTQIGLLEDAVMAYSIHTGQLPQDLNALLAVPADLADPATWRGPYLDKFTLPTDPWDRQFRHQVVNAEELRFRIWSVGPDGVSGTWDDVVAER
jgi:general secretion pathway protein G